MAKIVQITVDDAELDAMNRLRDRLQSPNLATALYNAVELLTTLYRAQDDGYEIRLVRDGDCRRIRLPLP